MTRLYYRCFLIFLSAQLDITYKYVYTFRVHVILATCHLIRFLPCSKRRGLGRSKKHNYLSYPDCVIKSLKSRCHKQYGQYIIKCVIGTCGLTTAGRLSSALKSSITKCLAVVFHEWSREFLISFIFSFDDYILFLHKFTLANNFKAACVLAYARDQKLVF